MQNKKGVSAIVATVLLIALTIGIVAIVWTVINSLVLEKISSAESCADIFDKVTLNNDYTCYNSSSKEVQFSIDIGDLEVDDLLVSIVSSGGSTSFTIPKSGQVANLVTYPARSSVVALPGKNAGLTYIFNLGAMGVTTAPDSIEISPTVSGNQCGITDTLNQIDSCLLLSQ